jgi:hypothetical protein
MRLIFATCMVQNLQTPHIAFMAKWEANNVVQIQGIHSFVILVDTWSKRVFYEGVLKKFTPYINILL